MARYTGPVCRMCRREGTKLFLKGDRCLSGKCAFDRRSAAPGQHGAARKQLREYGMQLREKQKARRYYGVQEKQFENYFEKADRQEGITGSNLLSMLERRLDNVIYRLGLAESRKEARQLVLHGHFRLNDKKVTIPSLIVKVGDVVTVKDSSKASEKIKGLIEKSASQNIPKWISYDKDAVSAKIEAIPQRDDVDFDFEEHLIVELYSK